MEALNKPSFVAFNDRIISVNCEVSEIHLGNQFMRKNNCNQTIVVKNSSYRNTVVRPK